MNRLSKLAPFGAVIATLIGATHAHAGVMTFDAIAAPSIVYYSSHTEAGFSLTSPTSLASWGSSDSNYNGSQAMFNDGVGGITTLSKVGGGSFSFNSIDLSEVFNSSSYSPTNVTFVADLTGGGTVSFSYDLDLVFGNETVNFGSLFSSVTAVRWAQTSDFHQFDNLVMDAATTVPEPTSLALVGLALAGLGLRQARRR